MTTPSSHPPRREDKTSSGVSDYRTAMANSPLRPMKRDESPDETTHFFVNLSDGQSESALCPLGHSLWFGICTDLWWGDEDDEPANSPTAVWDPR